MVSLRSRAAPTPSSSSAPTNRAKTTRKPTNPDSNNTSDNEDASVLRRHNTTKPASASTTTTAATAPAPKDKDGAEPKARRAAALRSVKKSRKAVAKRKTRFCVCKGLDDGTPMIQCNECDEWYHFRCIKLAERDAEEIRLYVCSPCAEKTGLRTVLEWEGDGAIEERSEQDIIQRQKDAGSGEASEPEIHLDAGHSESSGEEASGDEYAEPAEGPGKATAKRRPRQPISDSESGGDESEEDVRKRKRPKVQGRKDTSDSPAPGPAASAKRRQVSSTDEPSAKRQKSTGSGAEDPARRFCLGKLEETICPIFLEYPHLDGVDKYKVESGQRTVTLTDNETAEVEKAAKGFVSRLEQCMFEKYAESDKSGAPSVGGKYKERFRTLTFNLKQADRVALRQGIAASSILPEQLSVMSSTDLANEQTRQSIAAAQKEALAHSILQKDNAPRAKITHKGFEDIEDVNFDATTKRGREREVAEEERERMQTQAIRRASSQSVAPQPQSPVTPQTPAWGAPPPTRTRGPQQDRPVHRLLSRPLFLSTESDMIEPVEGELNLADLINLDEESTPTNAVDPLPTPLGESSQPPPPPSAQSSVVVSDSPVTALSPFAPRPETQSRSSFDLKSLWSGPLSEAQPVERSVTPSPSPTRAQEQKEIDFDFGNEGDVGDTEDQDFDMFLEEEVPGDDATKEHEIPAAAPDVPMTEAEKFAALSVVWSGPLTMPLENTVPLGSPMNARQIGGRSLGDETSPLWRALFPADSIRIDGRVPIDKAAPYLLQMRMNSMKELIAVALSPKSEADKASFQELIDFLIGKSRYGLIFPWGSRPVESAPGRELYIVPLLASQDLPDYMEMLDDIQISKSRAENLIIGIWVLNKGKLTAPVASTIASTPPLPSSHTGTPAHVPGAPPPPPPHINPDALAAEVASLTPEQIQLMLQTLSAANNPLLAATTVQPIPLPVPGSTIPPHGPPQWSSMPLPPPPTAPFPHPQRVPYPQSPPQPHSPSQHQYGRYDDNGGRGGFGRDRDDRGGGRGRGTRGRARGDFDRRSQDRGWGGHRGRGQNRDLGSSSNQRGQW